MGAAAWPRSGRLSFVLVLTLGAAVACGAAACGGGDDPAGGGGAGGSAGGGTGGTSGSGGSAGGGTGGSAGGGTGGAGGGTGGSSGSGGAGGSGGAAGRGGSGGSAGAGGGGGAGGSSGAGGSAGNGGSNGGAGGGAGAGGSGGASGTGGAGGSIVPPEMAVLSFKDNGEPQTSGARSTSAETAMAPTGQVLSIMSTYGNASGSLGITIIKNPPPLAAGRYDCGPLVFMALSVSSAEGYTSQAAGASCTVTLTQVGARSGDKVVGTFSGKLRSPAGMMRSLDEGRFDLTLK
jgi:hypothetical protein